MGKTQEETCHFHSDFLFTGYEGSTGMEPSSFEAEYGNRGRRSDPGAVTQREIYVKLKCVESHKTLLNY